MSKEKKKALLKTPEGSVFSKGYGIVAKMAMQDQELSVEAKAIYSYLCSYMGAGDTAWPSVKKICFDLGIGKDRYHKHMTMLIEQKYIKRDRRYYTATGQWANNVYELIFDRE